MLPVSRETYAKFVHAIGSRTMAKEWIDCICKHAESAIHRVDHAGLPWYSVAAWPSRQTRRELPRHALTSCAVDREAANALVMSILFDLITEGRA